MAQLAPVFAAVRPVGRARRADPPRGGPARPLASTCSRRCSHARARVLTPAARLGERGAASRVRALRAGVPRDVRVERRAWPRVPRAACPTSTSRPTCCAGRATGSSSTSTHRRPDSAHTTSRADARASSEIVVRASSEPASEHALEVASSSSSSAGSSARSRRPRRRGLRPPARAVRGTQPGHRVDRQADGERGALALRPRTAAR